MRRQIHDPGAAFDLKFLVDCAGCAFGDFKIGDTSAIHP